MEDYATAGQIDYGQSVATGDYNAMLLRSRHDLQRHVCSWSSRALFRFIPWGWLLNHRCLLLILFRASLPKLHIPFQDLLCQHKALQLGFIKPFNLV